MKAITMALFAMAIGLGPAQTFADQTNLVQNLHIQLFGISQGGTTTNRGVITTSANFTPMGTRQIIAALGTVTGNTFSSASRLVLVTPQDGSAPSVQVRDGDNTVDVSAFVVSQALSGTVVQSTTNQRSGRSFGTQYSVQRLVLQDGSGAPALGLHFDVNGLSVQNTGFGNGASNISVVGVGDVGGNSVIVQGFIDVTGGTLEVVSGGFTGQT